MRGGKRPNAGRKAATPNKVTAKKIERAQAGGIMPLDYILQVMRDPRVKRDERIEAAKAAAPYLHSKMPTAIVTPPPPSRELTQSDEDIINTYMGGVHAESEQD